MGKYFTVTVRPEIPAATQHLGNFADADALFDWTAFNVPKGANRLLNITAIVRKEDATTSNEFPFSLVFGKSINKTAPNSIGTLHGTASGTGYQHNLIGKAMFIAKDNLSKLDNVEIFTLNAGGADSDHVDIVLEGEPDSGVNVGFDKLYVAGIAEGTLNFSSAVVTSRAVDVSGLSAAELVNADIEGTDPRTVFAPGDIIHAEDGVVLGEIESMADANTITFKTDGSKVYHANGETLYTNADGVANWIIQNGAGAAGDLDSGDELYNIHPITLIFSFER
tara:strand:- start:426 stop:1265 length:840 start_codon:yes stop_codon:yes gene_type:complete